MVVQVGIMIASPLAIFNHTHQSPCHHLTPPHSPPSFLPLSSPPLPLLLHQPGLQKLLQQQPQHQNQH